MALCGAEFANYSWQGVVNILAERLSLSHLHFTSSEQTRQASSTCFLDHFEHFLHLTILLHEPIDILNLKTATPGNTPPAASI